MEDLQNLLLSLDIFQDCCITAPALGTQTCNENTLSYHHNTEHYLNMLSGGFSRNNILWAGHVKRYHQSKEQEEGKAGQELESKKTLAVCWVKQWTDTAKRAENEQAEKTENLTVV